MLQKLFRLMVIFCISIGFVCIGMLSVIVFEVFFGDTSYLKKSTIIAKINEETSIFYLDEQNTIGSIFDVTHRKYVNIDEVPIHLLNAIIATEDKYFYYHIGINPIAIIKAFFEGISTFKFRGASTLTQQTVKNILDRREYSLKRKFKEAIAALQLERLYSKREILEFYINQFHVVSNGHGIGVAARYYFDKDVSDVNLVEAAFLAGSVKAPSKYNPFIKFNKEARNKAIEDANARKNYVLKQMYEQGYINQEEYEVALNIPVPFKKGNFGTKDIALTQLIKEHLDKPEILNALGLDNINELNNAGLKIYTTLDFDLQRVGQLAMKRNLSRLETILNGFKAEDLQNYKPQANLEINNFYFAKVTKVIADSNNATIHISLGLPSGVIPYESLVRYAKILDIPLFKGWKFQLQKLLKTIKPDDIVFVECKDYDSQTNKGIFELHRFPKLNGGLIAIDKGEVRAVIPGFNPEGYNRAIYARRQAGSAFKSLVYYAAFQLGWNMLDQLDNDRSVFVYQGRFYYPRPDHPSPYKKVSILWSGVKSENLAAVYLTARLVEKLNFDQFKILLDVLDLSPINGELKRDYHYRVARSTGVQLDNEGIMEFQLQRAINDFIPDLVFVGEQSIVDYLKKMWWGRGYIYELKQLLNNPEDLSESEQLLRINLLQNNFQRHLKLADSLIEDWKFIETKLQESSIEDLENNPEFNRVLQRFRILPSKKNIPQIGYFKDFEDEFKLNTKSNINFLVIESNPGRALNSLDIQTIWIKNQYMGFPYIDIKEVKLNGYLPLKYFNQIKAKVEEKYNNVINTDTPYDLYKYFQHHDFRIAVGLEYLKKLCKEMGVFSKIDPVLSFSLGTNDVSLGEIAKIYQTFIGGKIYRFYKSNLNLANQLTYIKKIEDRYGNIIYEPQKEEFTISSPEYSMQIQQILKKVVTHGTGRRARGELYVKLDMGRKLGKSSFLHIRVPAFGKTGTTNDYTSAVFAGFLPYPTIKGKPLNLENSYVIATYVGYDLNKPMERGSFKITGAVGALPVWTDFAKGIIESKKYSEYLDTLDLRVIAEKEWPIHYNIKSYKGLKVDLAQGLLLRQAQSSDIETFKTTDIAVTGEDYDNEFALDTSIKSVVYLPTSILNFQDSSVISIRRQFDFFKTTILDSIDRSSQDNSILSININNMDSSQNMNKNKSFNHSLQTTDDKMFLNLYDSSGKKIFSSPSHEDDQVDLSINSIQNQHLDSDSKLESDNEQQRSKNIIPNDTYDNQYLEEDLW